jgi:hypothetical protein
VAKNAFTELKNRYAGTDTVTDKLSAAAEDRMADLYEQTYNKIFKALSDARRDVNYATYAKQTQLLKQIGEQLAKFRGSSGEYFARAIHKITEYSTRVAIKDLEALGAGITKAPDWHYKYNEKYAEQTFKDNFKHIAAQTTKMRNSIKTMLRADAAQVFRRAAVEGVSRKEAYRQLKAQVMERDPKFQFTDKAGRNWDSRKYFEMLTRTVMAYTLRETYANSLTAEGHDLVKVSIRGATDECRLWEGKILSLSGATEGFPSLDDAIATGEVFHPRCRHRLIAYHEEIEDVFKVVEEGKMR